MSALHIPLVVQGTPVGDLITVGQQVVLFTARPALRRFDGATFSTVEAAAAALAAALGPAGPEPEPARAA